MGRSYSIGENYRFGFQTQEKSPEIYGNSYTAEFWQYDARIARRWNVDPKPLAHVSNYATFLNNPINSTDFRGDTVLINDQGKVTRNDKNGDGILLHPYSFKDKNNKEVKAYTQFYLNDPELDAAQMDNFDVGKQLVRFLNEEEVNWILYKSGASGGFSNIIQLAIESQGAMDFGNNFLRPYIVGQSGAEGLTLADRYPEMWDQNGGFIFFKGPAEPKVFNIPDAGNFLFGAAANRIGADYLLLLAGSQANSILTGWGADSKADQSALAQGYLYGYHLESVHKSTYPVISFMVNYDKSRPSWFDKKMDVNVTMRR